MNIVQFNRFEGILSKKIHILKYFDYQRLKAGNVIGSKRTKKITIALDLEGTVISNAVSQFSRPGLFTFLEYCHQNFERLVIFTAVKEVSFRAIARTLADSENVPV